MIRLNYEKTRDKIYACWLGKNIGGTIGTPFEGKREFLDISGFTTEKGNPLPNDDLDLQLVWLIAMETDGAKRVNAEVLGEHWLRSITPEWNEYGICKANLRRGIMPPMSGELFNEQWKNSNGAWIRSEIWACLAPGLPDTAIRFAIEDAMVDHGMGEGTYAELFTAALESAAFMETDIRRLIVIGLSKLPENCRVAKTVRMALSCYDSGMTLREARDAVVREVSDLGWFQAPGNVAFVVLGLLYGEGDFKRSMIAAVDCGDDTDCTGATVGAILGIRGGMAAIPGDWAEYIGDSIVTISVALAQTGFTKVPKTCTELTDRVMRLIPTVLNSVSTKKPAGNGLWECMRDVVFITDGESDWGDEYSRMEMDDPRFAQTLCDRIGYSYDVSLGYGTARVEFPDDPFIGENETKRVRIRFFGTSMQTNNFSFRIFLPDGFTCKGSRGVMIYRLAGDGKQPVSEFFFTAGETLSYVNRAVIELTGDDHGAPKYIPIDLIAK